MLVALTVRGREGKVLPSECCNTDWGNALDKLLDLIKHGNIATRCVMCLLPCRSATVVTFDSVPHDDALRHEFQACLPHQPVKHQPVKHQPKACLGDRPR
jgi:hypothetical protein